MQQNQADFAEAVQPILDVWKDREGPLLPILNAILQQLGHVPRSVIPMIAEALNLSRADVYGVVSFYHDYRAEKPGRHILKLCRAEACQSMGGDALADQIQKVLGIRFGETSADGALTLEPVYCLGLCACSPAALLDGQPIGRLDETIIRDILTEVRAV